MTILAVPNLATELTEGATPLTLRWFRNGIQPSAPAGRREAEHINLCMAQRMRVVFSHAGAFTQDANAGGIFEGFDPETNSDITTYRVAFRTGPVTRRLRARFIMLPADSETTATDGPYAMWVLRTGITGAGSTTDQAQMYLALISGLADRFQLSELLIVEHTIDVSPDAYYRLELHQVNRARVVSATVWEEPRVSLDTTVDTAAVDPTAIYVGSPITQKQYRDMLVAAERVWKIGQPLLQWTADVGSAGTNLPHEPRSRTSATPANVLDQSYTAFDAAAPGFPVIVSYSGTLDSPNIPVVIWAYASCVSGTGSILFKDQAGNTIASIAPAGAAAWYSATGNLKDASGSPETTEIQVLFAGDATNACVVHAFGMLVYS